MKSLPASVLERLQADREAVLGRLRSAETRAGRPPGSCRLLAVVKNVPDDIVAAFQALGHRDVAENRVQARESRGGGLSANTRWHLIGHLQTNKVRRALDLFQEFHALDSVKLARRLGAEAAARGLRWPVYVEVNVGREPQKHGVSPEEAPALAAAAAALPGLEVRGLMTLAPFRDDPRPVFRELRELAAALRERGDLPPDAAELSMGMSHDFETAVEEGATVVRVGTALFEGALSERQPPARTEPPFP